MQKWIIDFPSDGDYLLWAFALMSPFFCSSLQSYLDNSSVMFSSLMPPNTLNFFRLQTWVFSYFPKVMLWTTAGLSSFKTKNWRKERRGEQTWWMNMWSVCGEFLLMRKPETLSTLVPFLGGSFWSTSTHNLWTSDHKRTTNCASRQKPVNSVCWTLYCWYVVGHFPQFPVNLFQGLTSSLAKRADEEKEINMFDCIIWWL